MFVMTHTVDRQLGSAHRGRNAAANMRRPKSGVTMTSFAPSRLLRALCSLPSLKHDQRATRLPG